MDKSRISFLAKNWAMKENNNKQSERDNTRAPEPSIRTDTVMADSAVKVLHSTPGAKTEKRVIKMCDKDKKGKKVKVDESSSFRLRDESTDDDSDVEQISYILRESRGIFTGGSGSGLPPAPPTPSIEGVEGYTLTRLQPRQGWLREDSYVEAPMEALNAFAQSPDKTHLEKEDDESKTEW